MTRIDRSYRDLRRLTTFEERYDYLSLAGRIGDATFGSERWVNQNFYRSREWKQVRNEVIARDNGCDLGVEGYDIHERIIIHHIVPLLMSDFDGGDDDLLLNPNNLISTTHNTHNAIHWGDRSLLRVAPPPRVPGDTTLWGRREF